MIGDAAMFASRDPVPLMESVVELVDVASSEEMPSLKAGVATGPALGRGGDWYGRPVNLAARITSVARPDSVLTDQAVRDALESADGDRFRFSFAGRRRFKGISDETAVHRVRAGAGERSTR
jgi:adenylate cyclase